MKKNIFLKTFFLCGTLLLCLSSKAQDTIRFNWEHGAVTKTIQLSATQDNVDFTINWGNGQVSALKTNASTMQPYNYNYANPGTSTVLIIGSISNLFRSLDVSDQILSSLDVSKAPSLQTLECNNNNIGTLSLLKNPELELLNCEQNNLIYLDLSQNPLIQNLTCNNNFLKTLNLNNCSNLLSLKADNNLLKTIDLSSNTALTSLEIYHNLLPILDLSSCHALINLDASNNIIYNINVSNCTQLKNLELSNNKLKSIDLSANTKLNTLDCSSNILDSITFSSTISINSINLKNNRYTLTKLYALIGKYTLANANTVLDTNFNYSTAYALSSFSLPDLTIDSINSSYQVFKNGSSATEGPGKDFAIRYYTPPKAPTMVFWGNPGDNFLVIVYNKLAFSRLGKDFSSGNDPQFATAYLHYNLVDGAGNSNLNDLSVSEGLLVPDFSPIIQDYTVIVGTDITNTYITAVPSDTGAIISGDGPKTLTVGTNPFTVRVTARKGSIKEYKITYQVRAKQDTLLRSLQVSKGILSPSFSPFVFNYTVHVPTTTTSTVITAKTSDIDASIQGLETSTKPLALGSNIFPITVTAQDTNFKGHYSINYLVEKDTDASLQSISTSKGSLSPKFNPDTLNYVIHLVGGLSSVDLYGTPTVSLSTITGNGTKYNLKTGNNIFTLKVYAEDPSYTRSYTVNYLIAPDTNARLDSLKVSQGSLSPSFSPSILNYTVNLSSHTHSTDIHAVPQSKAASVTGAGNNQTLVAGSNVFNIDVKAENPTFTKRYTIDYQVPPNNDASLKSLDVSSGKLSPAFSSNVLVYYDTVENSIDTLSINAFTTDDNAHLSGNNFVNLNTGSQVFQVVTLAEDSTTSLSYDIHVFRKLSDNAYLKDLSITSGDSISPTFDSLKFNYTVNIANNISSTTINATSVSTAASISGTGLVSNLNTGNNNFIIKVTSEDGLHTLSYKLNIIRAKNADSTLSSLSLSQATLNPLFSSGIQNYTASLPNNISRDTIKATSTRPESTITGTGPKVLNVGNNDFPIKVTAENGAILIYNVQINRAANGDTSLSYLGVSPGKISPVFDPNHKNYSLSFAYDTNQVLITAIANTSTSTVMGTGLKTLVVGLNTFPIKVTAENGKTQSYQIQITRKKNTDAKLSVLSTSVGSLNPSFSSDTLNYDVTCYNDSLSTLILATSRDSLAVITGDTGRVNLRQTQGDTTYKIIVTAADGIIQAIYKINYHIIARGTDAGLKSLSVSKGKMKPVFDQGVYNYNVNLGTGYTNTYITAIVNDPKASYTGDTGLQALPAIIIPNHSAYKTFAVHVVAENGTTTTDYKINYIIKQSTNNYLKSLSLDHGNLNPIFDSLTTSYTLALSDTCQNINIAALVSDPKSLLSGDIGSQAVNIAGGTYNIAVQSENDSLGPRVYSIAYHTISSEARLSSLSASHVNLKPSFSPDTYIYHDSLSDYRIDSIDITAIALDPNASSIADTGKFELQYGFNSFPIKVIAQDTNFSKIYTLTVYRPRSNNANLDSILFSNTVLDQAFDSLTYNGYTASVASSINRTYIRAIPSQSNSKVIGGGWINLVAGDNPVSIKVIADDSAYQNTYHVNIIKVLDTNANLSSLSLTPTTPYSKDTIKPGFKPTIYNYNIEVGADSMTTNKTIISAVSQYIDAQVGGAGPVNLVAGNNVLKIIVTAEDPNYKKTYTINYFVRQPKSKDTTLKSLSIIPGILSPAFNPHIFNYSSTVADSVNRVELTAQANSPKARVIGAGSKSAITGLNTYKVRVIAEDISHSSTYTIDYTVLKSKDAKLRYLGVNLGILSPSFSPDQFNYTVDAPAGSTSSLVTAIPNSNKASVSGAGLNNLNSEGLSTINIIVTAQDSSIKNTYTIVYNVARSQATISTLDSLIVSQGDLNPVFDPERKNYTVHVGANVKSTYIHAVPTDSMALVSGEIGQQKLHAGNNYFTIFVTAEDGLSLSIYTINYKVDYPLGNNPKLASLDVSLGYLSPQFYPDNLNYVVNIYDISYDTTTITAISEDPNALIRGAGHKKLQQGKNNFLISVTSQDGKNSLTYVITYILNVKGEESALASLDIMSTNSSESSYLLSPAFEPSILVYSCAVTELEKAVNIIAPAKDINASVNGDGYKELNPGINKFLIRVTAEDLVNETYYFLNVFRAYPTGNENGAEFNLLNLYPNPSTRWVYISTKEGSQKVHYQLYNPTGKLLHKDYGDAIDLDAYPQGLYFVKIGGKMYKIIKS